jgi:hypothetical protein
LQSIHGSFLVVACFEEVDGEFDFVDGLPDFLHIHKGQFSLHVELLLFEVEVKGQRAQSCQQKHSLVHCEQVLNDG